MRAQAERRAFSFVCLGSMADAAKTALVALQNALARGSACRPKLVHGAPQAESRCGAPTATGGAGSWLVGEDGDSGSNRSTTGNFVRHWQVATAPVIRSHHCTHHTVDCGVLGARASNSVVRHESRETQDQSSTCSRAAKSTACRDAETSPVDVSLNPAPTRCATLPRIALAARNLVVVECEREAMASVAALAEECFVVRAAQRLGMRASLKAALFCGDDLDRAKWRRVGSKLEDAFPLDGSSLYGWEYS